MWFFPNKMKTLTCVIFALLATFALGQICFEPESESQVILTVNVINAYAAYDYNQGKIVFTSANDTMGDDYTMIDLVNNITYISNSISGCIKLPGYSEVFSQCLPDDAVYVHTIDEHDLYYISRPQGLDWLVGLTLDEDTGYYQRFISRYAARGNVLDVGVTYQNNIGVSDPAVFDRNVTDCTWALF